MHGILAVDKPQGWTSHDVVARVRRLSGQRKAGHAGTLDPMATGVLLVCLGEATRLSELLMDGTKWYAARVAFGAATDTDDAEGRVIARASPSFTRADLLAALGTQVGYLHQTPPAYAAIKQEGVPAYRRARQGQLTVLAPRPVTVHALALLAAATTGGWADLLVSCSKGTYIRAIARDLGTALGCGAHLGALRRLASGAFSTRDCIDLRTLDSATGGESIRAALLPADAALDRMPSCLLGPSAASRVAHGMAFTGPGTIGAQLRVYDQEGHLAALAIPDGPGERSWRPVRVFGGGV